MLNMKEPKHISHKNIELNKTLNIKKLIGKKVISKAGTIIGKIKHIHIHPEKYNLEAIHINRGFFKSPLIISEKFINKMTHDALLLNIEPYYLLKNKKIITSDGETLGKAININRKSNTNEITSITMRSFLKQDIEIPISNIKSQGHSIILKPSHNVKTKYIWQKSK